MVPWLIMPELPPPPPLTDRESKTAAAHHRERAWGVAIANQLALPGFGTVMAGRKVGYAQLGLSVTGVVCFSVFLLYALPRLGALLDTLMNPPEDPELALQFLAQWLPWCLLALTGIILWVSAWCWALGTSVKAVREMPARTGGRTAGAPMTGSGATGDSNPELAPDADIGRRP